METPQTQQPAEKKKFPGWVKAVIIVAVVGVGLLVVAGFGFSLLVNYMAGKGGEKLVTAGIEKLIEKGIEESGGGRAEVKLNEEGLVVKGKEGGEQFAIRTGQGLPAGFPGDIPVFSPSAVTGSMVMGPMTLVTLESPSAVPEITSFYQGQLPALGWTATFSGTPGPENFTAIYGKEKRQVTVGITPSGEEGKTSIVLSYGTVP